MASEKANIIVVDDEDLIRKTLSAVLGGAGYSVSSYGSGIDLLKSLPELDLDCLVLDVRMPKMNGIDVLEVFRRNRPGVPVVVMSGYADVSMAVEAMQAGATDFVEKPFKPKDVLSTMERAMKTADRTGALPVVGDPNSASLVASLSAREKQVLKLLVQGMQNKFIARELGISPRTVEVHRARIMQRMGVSSFAEVVRHSVLAGIAES